VIMISTGLIALAMAGVQHHESLRLMRATYGTMPRSVAGPVAGLVAVLGVFALLGVIARV
jgi:putative membrane protein